MTDEDVLGVLLSVAAALSSLVERTPIADRARCIDQRVDQFAIDIAADALAVRMLLDAGFGVLSEESGRHDWDAVVRVVVDPIDGSTNCARGLPSYGPSLCAVDGRGPVAAVVMNVPLGTTYAARRGWGATKNGVALSPTQRDRIGVVITGDPVHELEPAVWTRVSGASAHDLCLVAEGAVDGYVDVRNTQSVWDYLGALLVLTESGGVVRERDGRELLDFDAIANRRLLAAPNAKLLDELALAVSAATHRDRPRSAAR